LGARGRRMGLGLGFVLGLGFRVRGADQGSD
jgi:hypothetical protein